jgi:hypothetical protein
VGIAEHAIVSIGLRGARLAAKLPELCELRNVAGEGSLFAWPRAHVRQANDVLSARAATGPDFTSKPSSLAGRREGFGLEAT